VSLILCLSIGFNVLDESNAPFFKVASKHTSYDLHADVVQLSQFNERHLRMKVVNCIYLLFINVAVGSSAADHSGRAV
jgi:hypothetical protein